MNSASEYFLRNEGQVEDVRDAEVDQRHSIKKDPDGKYLDENAAARRQERPGFAEKNHPREEGHRKENCEKQKENAKPVPLDFHLLPPKEKRFLIGLLKSSISFACLRRKDPFYHRACLHILSPMQCEDRIERCPGKHPRRWLLPRQQKATGYARGAPHSTARISTGLRAQTSFG